MKLWVTSRNAMLTMHKMASLTSHLRTIITRTHVKQSFQMMKPIGLTWNERINELNLVSNHSKRNGQIHTKSSSFGMMRSSVEKNSSRSKRGTNLMIFSTLSLKMISMVLRETTQKGLILDRKLILILSKELGERQSTLSWISVFCVIVVEGHVQRRKASQKNVLNVVAEVVL